MLKYSDKKAQVVSMILGFGGLMLLAVNSDDMMVVMTCYIFAVVFLSLSFALYELSNKKEISEVKTVDNRNCVPKNWLKRSNKLGGTLIGSK